MYIPNRPADLTLWFTAPPSVNAAYKSIDGNKRAKSKAYKEWLKLAAGELLCQKRAYFNGAVCIGYTLFFKDKRVRDVANYEKCMSDMLVKYGILKDDSYIAQNLQQLGQAKHLGLDLTDHKVRVEIFALQADK